MNGLELMVFDAQRDCYEFLLVKKIDVEEILDLANNLSFGIEPIRY